MDKPKRNYNAEGSFDSSMELHHNDRKSQKQGDLKEPQIKKPARFYTVETIVDLINRIKRL